MCIEFQHMSCQVVVIKAWLTYLLILLQLLLLHVVDSVIAVFLENSENDSKLKDWIYFGIYWKNLLSHSRPWPWVCGLGLACLWP